MDRLLCSDLVFVLLFPQLLVVIHMKDSCNKYGCIVSFFIAATLRVLGNSYLCYLSTYFCIQFHCTSHWIVPRIPNYSRSKRSYPYSVENLDNNDRRWTASGASGGHQVPFLWKRQAVLPVPDVYNVNLVNHSSAGIQNYQRLLHQRLAEHQVRFAQLLQWGPEEEGMSQYCLFAGGTLCRRLDRYPIARPQSGGNRGIAWTVNLWFLISFRLYWAIT